MLSFSNNFFFGKLKIQNSKIYSNLQKSDNKFFSKKFKINFNKINIKYLQHQTIAINAAMTAPGWPFAPLTTWSPSRPSSRPSSIRPCRPWCTPIQCSAGWCNKDGKRDLIEKKRKWEKEKKQRVHQNACKTTKNLKLRAGMGKIVIILIWVSYQWYDSDK